MRFVLSSSFRVELCRISDSVLSLELFAGSSNRFQHLHGGPGGDILIQMVGVPCCADEANRTGFGQSLTGGAVWAARQEGCKFARRWPKALDARQAKNAQCWQTGTDDCRIKLDDSPDRRRNAVPCELAQISACGLQG